MLSLLKLITVLLLIPTLYSLLPYRKLSKYSKCYVGPSSNEHVDNKGIISVTNEKKQYVEDDSSHSYIGVWISPYVQQHQFNSRMLNKCNFYHPTSQTSDRNHPLNTINGSWLECDDKFYTKYDTVKKAWCFVKEGDDSSHGTGSTNIDTDQIFCMDAPQASTYILSGTYTQISNNGKRSTISVTCFNSKEDTTRRSTINNTKFYPATSALLLLNVGLAFIYWDKRINPSTVSKQYSKIVSDMQLWRSFTGALAHFEALHLMFNMMTLQALGTILEEKLGSVPFLYSNICLIPLTTIVMLTMIHIQIRMTGNDRYAQTSTVGYSGVLFAWSVVSSLESNAVCPIPFAQDVCFNTHRFHIGFMTLKFNLGPFVQLLLMQVIMPRTSFVGHLSGIICGYMFHWKMLPYEIIWKPQVFIPLLLLLHWQFVRNFISTNDRDDGKILVEDNLIEEGGNTDTLTKREEADMKKEKFKFLHLVKRYMIGCLILSFLIFDVYSSLIISQVLCFLTFGLSAQCHTRTDQTRSLSLYSSSSQMLNKSAVLWRGTIITLVLLLVTDAMIVPIWFNSRLLIYSYSKHFLSFDLWLEPAILAIRWVIHFGALVVASKSLLELGDIESEPKVFDIIFGPIVRWCSDLMNEKYASTTHTQSSQSFSPFGGEGVVLGGSGGTEATPSHRSRLIHGSNHRQ